MFIEFAISITILLFSVVIHEVSHGAVANMLGDPTARLQGRLTLNPLKHLDPIGSVLVPVVTSLIGVPFGWAKPVPYNPHNLSNKRWGSALVGGAGPLSNIVLAVTFGLAARFGESLFMFSEGVFFVFVFITYINLLLAVFNLVPIPPLDGSKLLFSFFPDISHRARIFLERNGFIFLLMFIFFGFQLIVPIIDFLFYLITGINFGPTL
ncbi:MAG: site-2 protease family protein [Candidatus Spechtbacterales bacterium]|nr:site-2 protease family protein [Candidatus Spechtbacterales bacterium]